MTHPFIGDNPHMWYTAVLEYTDGANVALWEPVLNGADIVDSGTPYGTYDADGMDGDPCVAFASGIGAVDTISGTFTATTEVSVVWRCSSGTITDETHLVTLCNSDGDTILSIGASSYTIYLYNWLNYGYLNVPSPYVEFPQDGTPFVIGFTFSAANGYRARIYLNGSLLVEGTFDAGTRSFSRVYLGPDASWADNGPFKVENGTIVPSELTEAEMLTLSDYIETPDPTYMGGGVTRYFTADGLTAGSHCVLTETPHGNTWVADFLGVTSPSGKYWDFSGHDGTDEVLYRAWFDVNNGSTPPADGGRTLVEIDVATGDDYLDWSTAAATAIDALTNMTASADAGILSVSCGVNAEIGAVVNGTLASIFTEVTKGGNDSALIAEIESSIGEAPTMQYLVLRPRRVRFSAVKPGTYRWLEATTPVGIYGATIPAGAMEDADRVFL